MWEEANFLTVRRARGERLDERLDVARGALKIVRIPDMRQDALYIFLSAP